MFYNTELTYHDTFQGMAFSIMIVFISDKPQSSAVMIVQTTQFQTCRVRHDGIDYTR